MYNNDIEKLLQNKKIMINWKNKHKDLYYKPTGLSSGVAFTNNWDVSNFDTSKLKIGLHIVEEPYDWMQDVIIQFNELKIDNIAYCFHCLTPGNFLPMHSDRYSFYATKNKVTDINKIIRIIVFLDNFIPGQLLLVDNKSYCFAKKGDIAFWTGTTPHLAANLSSENRYTLQITGTMI